MTFPEMVSAELARAREKHAPINSLHEGYAVLLEEVEEFWSLVMAGRKRRDRGMALAELVQIAAMAQRIAEDCNCE